MKKQKTKINYLPIAIWYSPDTYTQRKRYYYFNCLSKVVKKECWAVAFKLTRIKNSKVVIISIALTKEKAINEESNDDN